LGSERIRKQRISRFCPTLRFRMGLAPFLFAYLARSAGSLRARLGGESFGSAGPPTQMDELQQESADTADAMPGKGAWPFPMWLGEIRNDHAIFMELDEDFVSEPAFGLPPHRGQPLSEFQKNMHQHLGGPAYKHWLAQFAHGYDTAEWEAMMESMELLMRTSGSGLDLPAAWKGKLKEGSIGVSRSGLKDDVYTARLASDEAFAVSIQVLSGTQEGDRFRLASVASRMCSFARSVGGGVPDGPLCSGHVAACFDIETNGKTSYALMEAYDRPLQELLDFLLLSEKETNHTIGTPVALERAVPILIDVLRGLQSIEEAGLVHAAVDPSNVLLVQDPASGEERAVLGGLLAVCEPKGGRRATGCRALSDKATGSDSFHTTPFFQPPEAVDGVPGGASDHVWSAGMIFAQMVFGHHPIELAAVDVDVGLLVGDKTMHGRRLLRNLVQTAFNIDRDFRWEEVHEDIRQLLEGMLAKDPQARLTTADALAAMERLAAAHGVSIPAARLPTTLPSSWWAEGDEGGRPRRWQEV